MRKKSIIDIPPMFLSPFRLMKGAWRRVWRFTILDRYILRQFLGTYFMATILFLAVIAMFDVTEKLDAFLTAPLNETLFDYFASFLPYFANQLSPLFVFISVIFFTSKLAGNSEIIAILASGVSYQRLLRPYMIGGGGAGGSDFRSEQLHHTSHQHRANSIHQQVRTQQER